MTNKKQYSLFTAISMIIGIVIGSGIFFKSDDILTFTGGSVWLGILVFAIAAISIIFGSLSIAQLAIRTDKPGGVVTYIEQLWSKPLSGAVGWFQTLAYYPTLIVVISWVASIYLSMILAIDMSLEQQCIIGFVIMTVIFFVNIYSKKLGDIFQISATIIKLIPLVLIAVTGLLFGNSANITFEPTVLETARFGFIAAIVPIAFSFDGWIISTSISNEIKDSKKSLPLALIFSPIFILIVYSLYLAGISALVGPENIINLGDEHVNVAANMLLGPTGAKLVLTFVLISVCGTVNGITMGALRMPYSLALRNYFPNSKKVSHIDAKLDIPLASSFVSYFICTIWFIVHYLVMKFDLLSGSDVSEIAIIINYICFIPLYFGVIKLFKKGEIKSKISGVLNPILATLGSVIIFLGSVVILGDTSISINIKAISFMLISVSILILSYFYCKSVDTKTK